MAGRSNIRELHAVHLSPGAGRAAPDDASRAVAPPASRKRRAVRLRPGEDHGWIVAIDDRPAHDFFASRTLAFAYARAYATLHRPSTLQLFDHNGNFEDEQHFESTLG